MMRDISRDHEDMSIEDLKNLLHLMINMTAVTCLWINLISSNLDIQSKFYMLP